MPHCPSTFLNVRLLAYTNLYPSAERPRHGIFVEERLRHLVATGRVDASVCALRPQNSFKVSAYFGATTRFNTETRHGIRVSYATVPTMPLITNWIDPIIWARASKKLVTDLIGSSRRDVILDAHFLYPDAVAAVMLGRSLDLPVVMTARGSDVNIKCENSIMRRWVGWAAKHCAAIITVSKPLAKKLDAFGISSDLIHVLPNGVDLDRFEPRPDSSLKLKHGVAGAVLLSAGHLLEGKGHHFAIEALVELPDVTLFIVGEGPEEQTLRKLAKKTGVDSRVRFLGFVPHERMADAYSAADYTVLASSNEGMPNVMLESLACGTRVIATDVGGVADVITDSVAGAVMTTRSATAIVESVRTLNALGHDRNDTRKFATQFGWTDTVQRQLALYDRLVSQ